MARKGPAPKPRELKIVQGTLRKDRDLGPVEVQVGEPECPDCVD